MIRKTLENKLNLLFGLHGHLLDYEELPVTFVKNNGTSSLDIDLTIADTGLQIPHDYKSFLGIFNGCTLFKYEDLGGFDFLGAEDIAKETAIQHQIYEQNWDKSITVFCRLVCDGDFISFRNYDNGSYDLLDCYHDDNPCNWKVIGDSFEDFLEKIIDGRGKKFWL